ncbi:hypothetical protein A2765_06125 [Candidatus Kaiserbacteria bacterium RIFCSPHIGHO2_01_FULL_56_24]|uniref:Histidine kinase/HSP90-like ATPase domain-containing protein n=1 Tax=Candidatus Kaiserbacteria bacterium RIFCSPHIGHO2_01_FULL_56_24 TaxID=1798487 RepID=A0A1F6D8P3_9BACT|nr:MAG: hypothetical protein A2765_06125 [Candidatus Kaiserbacteria bacterium RIFCSPHIGHO2_01_FULL_56_24]
MFYQIAIEDNGDGFNAEQFASIMEGGVGSSRKREQKKKLINGRPVVGRLGIGLLGIAQISGDFIVASRPKNGKAFAARIHLYDFLKEELDEKTPKIIDVGEYELLEKDLSSFLPEKNGTRIITKLVHPTFTDAFQKSLKAPKFVEPTRDWKEVMSVMSGVQTLRELGDYWKLLWELAASSPIPYLNTNALPGKLIAEMQEQLESYKFSVYLDGLKLAKPIFLKRNPAGYTKHKIDQQRKRVYGKDVDFHGYIIVQEGKQLQPDELRGILVRLKNVAIGYYDPSMLDYRTNQGPRSRWLTGEIYVDDGLEDALNLDRDSFNRFHPEYRVVQDYIHNILTKDVFPEVYKQIEVRTKKRNSDKDKGRQKHLRSILSESLKSPVTLKKTSGGVTAGTKKKLGKLEVSTPDEEALDTKKSNRKLASAVLSIFEVALRENDAMKTREKFKDLLLKLLADW